MQISYNWLKLFLALKQTPETVAELLTSIGLEVETVQTFEQIKGGLKGLVIGEIIACEKHPNADKLSKTMVDIGGESLVPIVCGAPNVAVGQKVIVATVGAKCYPTNGEPFEIQISKIRGEISQGMICAEDEIGIGTSHDGILILDTYLPNGTEAAQYYKIENDSIFTIGLTPNRADAASHIGVAKDLYAAITEQNNQAIDFKIPEVSDFKPDSSSDNIHITIENLAACPRYAGVCISNITVAPSPSWLQNRLLSIGINPINNIVDVTNYVLHELGQPLHAFDRSKISGNSIIVKNATADTIFQTLDGKERKLFAGDLMICNANEPVVLAGIFGGIKAGITAYTTQIFLESAYFSPDGIRKSSQLHGLKTDASFRYERGTDPNMVIYALKRAALLIKEIAGGQITSAITDIYPAKIENFKFLVKYQHINRLIGNTLPKNKIFAILDSLEIGVLDETIEGFTVSVPPYRVDVLREVDIIEEIIRIYGFDNIQTNQFLGASFLADFPVITNEKIANSMANILVGKGFNEIMTNSLTHPSYSKSLGLDPLQNVEILNKLSPELGTLRQSMVTSGLESIAYNINRKQKDLKLFEIGKTYSKVGNSGTVQDYKETTMLSVFVTGNIVAENWTSKSKYVDFYTIAEIASQLLFGINVAGIVKTDVDFNKSIWLHANGLEKNNKIIGMYGQLHTNVCKELGIKQQVYYSEFNMDSIYKMISNKLAYAEIAKYPKVRRDLSLVIDKSINYQAIEKIARTTEKKLLASMNVFDVYEGDKISSGKKSYSISFELQDQMQTLTDTQIDTTMQKLIQAFDKELGAVVRE